MGRELIKPTRGVRGLFTHSLAALFFFICLLETTLVSRKPALYSFVGSHAHSFAPKLLDKRIMTMNVLLRLSSFFFFHEISGVMLHPFIYM